MNGKLGKIDIEIERKFLVRGGNFPRPKRTVRELSFYLPSKKKEEIRVQDREGKCVLEVKRQLSPLSRERMRAEISESTFKALLKLIGGRKNAIERKLHYLPGTRSGTRSGANQTTTVREYSGKLKGLVRAEVTFGSEKEALAFKKPGWMGQEITSGPLGRNNVLFSITRKAFLKELESFN